MQRTRVIAGTAALAALAGAALWWIGPKAEPGAQGPGQGAWHAGAHGEAGAGPGAIAPGRVSQGSVLGPSPQGAPADSTDPLLVHGLRDTLEAMLLEAGDASDPSALKQRLAALVGRHFPPALAARALALAERYVDYRVALGRLDARAPQDLADPRALRDTMEARHKVRQQFFDGAEYDALFAREAELDRYTLARLEIARNTSLTPDQRAQALQAADNELPPERRAERAASTEHMAAAAQTAAFNAQNASDLTRHQSRSAQYGEAAAHALAQLDREERHWQQRLDQYSQASARPGRDSAALAQLRQQLFTSDEQQRVDAALALRRLGSQPSGS